MSSLKNVSLAMLFMLPTLACKTVQPQSSQGKHDAGRFLNSTDSSIWGNFSEAEYQALQAKAGYSKMLPADHAITKRLQFWADTIRAKMTEIMPELAHVPAPKVRILKSDSVNAFAQAARLSFNADIIADSSTAVPTGETVVLGEECYADCTEFQGDLEAKRALVEAGQKRINPACKVQATHESLEISENCLASPTESYKGPKRFNRYIATQVLNYITIFSETIKVMSESDIIVTLAHELGHYYLAHPLYLQFPDDSHPYNYVYVKSAHRNSGRPVSLSKDDPSYGLVKELDETIDVQFPILEGQKYPTVIDLAIAKSVSNGLNRGGIVDRCVSGTDLNLCLRQGYEVTKPGNMLTEWAFRYTSMDSPEALESARSANLKFEEALAQNANILRSSVLSDLQESLAKYIGRSAPPVFLGDKDETIASFLPGYIEKAKAALIENPKIVARLTQAAADKRLGFYTAEQEADDVAAEISYELGFEPELLVKNWMNSLERSSETEAFKESCRANYASGFKSPVWIGLSTNPHHNSCYRAYNAFWEIDNHREFFEKNKIATRPIPPGVAWDDMVIAMKGKNFIAIPAK